MRKGISQPPDPCHVAEVKSLGPKTGFLHSLSKRIQSPCCCTGLFSPGNNQDGGNIFNRELFARSPPSHWALASKSQPRPKTPQSTIHHLGPRHVAAAASPSCRLGHASQIVRLTLRSAAWLQYN